VERPRGSDPGIHARLDACCSILWEVGLQRCDLRAIDWAGGPQSFVFPLVYKISMHDQKVYWRPHSGSEMNPLDRTFGQCLPIHNPPACSAHSPR